MELRQLEHFLAVVETGSFTAAAARLYMVQSSLSSSLLALEREIGTELFIRGRRGAELTDAGQALVSPARAVLADLEQAQDAVAAHRNVLRGTVRLATTPVPRRINVVETMREFRDRHPGVDLYVFQDGARNLVDLVANSQVDFAVSPLAPDTRPALRFEPLLSTPVVAICRTDHPLAGRQDIDPAGLLDETIIDLPRGWSVRTLFDRMVGERRAQIEVNEWFGVLTMVRQGLGISYGPRALMDQDVFDGLSYATVAGALIWELGIVTRDEALRGAAGRAFLAAYREHCRTALADYQG